MASSLRPQGRTVCERRTLAQVTGVHGRVTVLTAPGLGEVLPRAGLCSVL